MASKNQPDDEFFGDLQEPESHDSIDREATTLLDLETAEAAAIERQYHTLGFHDAYEETKDSLLQEGFEAGYRQNFDVAVRIGHLLGEHIATERLLPPIPTTASTRMASTSLPQLIRKAILQADVSLSDLEAQVNDCIQANKSE